MMKSLKYFLWLLLFCNPIFAQQKKNITAEQAFKNALPSLYNYPPSIKWLDQSHYLFQRRSGSDADKKQLIVDAATGRAVAATDEEVKKFEMPSGKEIISKDNDLFLKTESVDIQLTHDVEEEKNATLSPDENYVAFTKNNNLFTIELATKKVNQITNDGSEVILNGYLSWVYMEEILGRPTKYKAFWWSTDSKKIAFYRTDDSPVPVFPIYDSEGLRGSISNTRFPQPGDANPKVKVGFVNAAGGIIAWAKFDTTLDQYFGTPLWEYDSNKMYLPWSNREQNNLKVYEINAADGAIKEVYDEKQKAWVSLDETSIITKLKNQAGFIIKSDKSGWMNLSWFDVNGKLKNEITVGNGDVSEIIFVEEEYSGKQTGRNLIFFNASKESPMRNDLYCVQLDGKNLKRLTFGNYSHYIDASPNANYFISTYSNHSDPGGIAVIDRSGKSRKIYEESNDAFTEYNIPFKKIFTVKSDDGLFDLPVKITYPADFDSTKKYPLMVNIYGGPNAKNISDNYSMLPSTIWWAQEGIVQVTIDHRGSGQFGKRGEEYMHRNLGLWEIADYSTAIKYLESKGWVNEKKVLIAGSSYGGYVTCLALTKGSNVFTHGIAGSSVTDWLLYDNIYTERYMDLPADNVEGYKAGSVLTYADQYQGKLLIVHGTADDNVHLQHSLQLVKAFQDRKKDFELMLYPTGKHGWGGNQGIHNRNLSNKFIYEYILEKPMPAGVLR